MLLNVEEAGSRGLFLLLRNRLQDVPHADHSSGRAEWPLVWQKGAPAPGDGYCFKEASSALTPGLRHGVGQTGLKKYLCSFPSVFAFSFSKCCPDCEQRFCILVLYSQTPGSLGMPINMSRISSISQKTPEKLYIHNKMPLVS